MSAYFSALAALAGSVIGGLTSLLAAWLTKRSEAEAQQLAQDKDRRQNLYKQFIDEASRMYADALSHNEVQVSAFVSIYALISRMRVISSIQVVAKAERVTSVIANAYSSPNMDFPELRKMLNSPGIDVLRDFSEACREELSHLPRSAL
jgi:ribosomal protein S25